MTEGRPVHALIVNAYSVENRGDAAIVGGLIDSLRRAGVGRVTVAPRGWRDAGGWRALGADDVVPPVLNVHEVPAWARRSRLLLAVYVTWRMVTALVTVGLRRTGDRAVHAYRRADLIVTAGGAYLGGPKLGTNLVKGFNIALGRLAGRRVIAAPMTITPPSRLVALILRLTLRGVTLFVRDEASAPIARSLGLEPLAGRDLALRSPALSAALASDSEPREVRPAGDLTIGWAPRDYRPDHDAWRRRAEVEAACVAAVVKLLEADASRVRFIAQTTVDQTDDDMQTVSRLRSMLPATVADRVSVAERPADVAAAAEAYGSFDVLLASRLHAGLLALAAGVPALVVGYEPKVAGVLAGLGLGHRVIPPDASWAAQEIADNLLSLLSDQERDLTERARVLAGSGYEEFDAVLQRAVLAVRHAR